MGLIDMQSALTAVQTHLAGPLGAVARAIFVQGPEDSVGFDYTGRLIRVWFDHDILRGQLPRWVRVSVGSTHRLYRGGGGFVLAEAGSMGLQSSTVYVGSDAEIIAVLEATLEQIRRGLWGKPARGPVINTPEAALALVQAELAGPLGGEAVYFREDGSTISFRYAGEEVCVQFPSAVAVGLPVAWVRVARGEWAKYLYDTPDGYIFASMAAVRRPGRPSHDVRSYGDLLEVLRAAREALIRGAVLPDEPVPAVPLALIAAVEQYFLPHLGIKAMTVARVHKGEPLVVVTDGLADRYTLYFDPRFLEGEAAGKWLQIGIGGPAGEGPFLVQGESGLHVGPFSGQVPHLAVAGLQGLVEHLPRFAAFLANWAPEAGAVARAVRPGKKPVMRLVNEPRLWRVTEKDSSFLSLPHVVRRMRADLSQGPDHPLSWDELVDLARKAKAFERADEVDPASDDLTEAVWMLASTWFKLQNPGVAKTRAFHFGMVVVEIACQDIASLGDFSEGILKAHDVAHGELARQQMAAASRADTARAVVDALARHFLPGGGKAGKPRGESPLRRVARGIAEEIGKKQWPHEGKDV